MSSAAPPTVETKPEPAEARFEDFMSTSIGTALKENPRMPTLEKDASADTEPKAADIEPKVAEKEPTPPEIEPKAADTEQKVADNPLLPDFSKLAFGEKAAERMPAELLQTESKPSTATEAPPVQEEFPEKLPGKATPQVEQAFQSMRKANTALYKQNAELTAKLKEVSARLKEFDGKTPMDRDEFNRITSERDEVVKELKLSKLEATPEYKAAITKPWNAIESEIKRLSTKYGLHEHQIRRAITESDPDKQSEILGSVTETFNDRDKLNLFKIADNAVEIAHKREILHKDTQQALDYIEAKRAADEEAKTAASKTEWSGALNKAWDTVGESLYLARPLPGNDEWNNSLKEAKDMVSRVDWKTMSPVDQAKVMVQAAILPRACIAITQLWNMYSEASNALKRYQGTTPGAGGGGSGAGSDVAPPPLGEEMGFIEAVESRVRRH